MSKLKKIIKRKERERAKRNIVIKGLRFEGKELIKKVEVLKMIDAKMEIEEVRSVENETGSKWFDMVRKKQV